MPSPAAGTSSTPAGLAASQQRLCIAKYTPSQNNCNTLSAGPILQRRRIPAVRPRPHRGSVPPCAIRFYEKQGFAVSSGEANPRSGAPVYKMSWRPWAAGSPSAAAR